MKPIVNFGDSYSTGSGLPVDRIERHLERLAYYGGTTLTNLAAGSNMSADQARAIWSLTPSCANQYTLLITNDAAIWAASAIKRAAAMDALRAILVHCAAPSKIIGRNAMKSGTWNDTPCNSIGTYNPVGALPARLAATVSGTAIYVQYIMQNLPSCDCSFEVRINGNLAGTVTPNPTAIGNTYVGNSFWPATRRFGGLPAGSHTVEIKPTNGAMYTFVDAFIGSDQATKPKVIVCKIPYRTTAGYALFPDNSDGNVDAYNAAITAVVSELSRDGLNVSLVEAAIDPATDLQADGVHPARLASLKLEDAFKAELE
jgi:hypothetical protein